MPTPLTSYSFKASNGVTVRRDIIERVPGMYEVVSKTNLLTRRSVQPGGIVQMMLDNDLETFINLTTCLEAKVIVPDPLPDCVYFSTGIETNREREVIFIVLNEKTKKATTTTFIKKIIKPAVITDQQAA
jgi:hypothetical protein